MADDVYDGNAPIITADGVKHEFPAGTPMTAVDKAMKSYAEEHRDKTTTMQQFGRGMEDPLIGLGQLGAHVLPGDTPGDAKIRAKRESRGEHVHTPPTTDQIDQFTREREEQIQKERGGSKNVDWARMTGEILSPANFLMGGLGAKTGEVIVEPLARRVLSPGLKLATETTAAGTMGGGVAGVLMPESNPEQFAKKKLAELGLGSMLGGAIGGAGGAAAGALTGWGSYLARTHPDNLTSDAVVNILKQFKQDAKAGGPSAADALDLVNAASKPIALFDTGIEGGNVEGLAGHVARQPGDSRAVAQAFLRGKEGRDPQAAARLDQDISQYVTSGPTAFQATQGLLEARTTASRPLYEEVNKLQNVWSPRLQQFFDHPDLKKGLQKGYELESRDSLAEGHPITASQMGVDIGIDGSTKILGVPNMRLLNMAKKGLDAAVSAARDPITGRLSEEGVSLNGLRKAYVEAIDQADTSGLYKKARQTWAGYSSAMDAVKMGKAVFKANPEEMAAEIKTMSPGDREFFRMGVADIMREKIGRAGFNADEAKLLVRNNWTEKLLRPVFENRSDYDHFVDAVTTERQMFDRGVRMVGMSPTAGRLAEESASNDEAMLHMGKMAGQVASGNMMGVLKGAWSFMRTLDTKENPKLNERISQILFTTNVPEDAAKMLRSGVISPRVNPKADQAGNIAGMSARLGAMGGQSAGEAMDQRQGP